MAVPITITDLSTTANSNSPAGSEVPSSGNGPDEYIRALGSIVRVMRAKGSDVASATTTDLGAATTGDFVHVTGTTTITGLGTIAAGIKKIVTFDGALTLTHNGTSLILPGAANITTSVGDSATFVSEGSGNWRCVSYVYASGIVSLAASQTWTGTQTFRDNRLEITDDSDTTKKLTLQASEIATGTTRTWTVGNYSGIPAVPTNEGTSGQVLTSAGAGAQPTWGANSAGAIVGNSVNLTAKNNSGTPNSKADITADEVTLEDSSNNYYTARTVSVTVDITASGANGLDTGAEASGTWYYLWLIYNGSAVAGLISASSTAPTMPSGYTYKALVGVVRNDGSSNFLVFNQYGREWYCAEQVVFTATTGNTAWTSQSISSFVPPNAKFAFGNFGASTNVGVRNIAISSDANGLGAKRGVTGAAGTLDSFISAMEFEVMLTTAQTMFFRCEVADVNSYRLTVTGFEI